MSFKDYIGEPDHWPEESRSLLDRLLGRNKKAEPAGGHDTGSSCGPWNGNPGGGGSTGDGCGGSD